MKEFGAHGGPILRLLTVGVLVTWGLATVLAVEVAGLPWQTAMVLGHITVTGPTVIGPLLRQIRPQGPSRRSPSGRGSWSTWSAQHSRCSSSRP